MRPDRRLAPRSGEEGTRPRQGASPGPLETLSADGRGRRIRYVCMPGSPYTGSTLLGAILNSHPACASIGAATGLSRRVQLAGYHCSCGKLFLECEFWSSIAARTGALGHPVDVFRAGFWNTHLRVSRSRLLNLFLVRSLAWAYGGAEGNTHFSRLSQITRSNVAQLRVAWTFDTADAFPGSEMECNPVVVDGVLYATTPALRVIALDAANGQLKWSFDPNDGRRTQVKARNRGVTVWDGGTGNGKRVFFAARQYLYALDGVTGKLIREFGTAGRIDLRENLDRDPQSLSVSATTPPVIYQGLLIIGSIVSETLPSSPGDIRAYDAVTGKLRWSFHTIPHPGEFGYETWPKNAWTYEGGANNWTGMTLDEKRGVVYVPTGSAAFDFYGANRLGDNLFANCLLALDARTGRRLWHFQTVHHDLWDRDLPAPPALVTVKRGARKIEALAQITKSGFVFVLDRDHGKPLFPVEERPFPASDVEGEKTAGTQPIPSKPAPFARQVLTEDLLTDRNPQVHQQALEIFRKVRSRGQFEPPSFAGTVIFPGFDGGGEWGGPAFDPGTGWLYVNANEMAWVLRLIRKKADAETRSAEDLYQAECAACHRGDRGGSPPEFPSLIKVGERLTDEEIEATIRNGSGRMPSFRRLPDSSIRALVRFLAHNENAAAYSSGNSGSPTDLKFSIDGYNRFLEQDGYPAIKPPWGTLNAIDLNSGDLRWKVPLGEYPSLANEGLHNTGTENYGGPIVTENGLLFIAATSFDRKIRAFDKRNGTLLWQADLPFAGNATPALYQTRGKEFLVIACGGGKSKDPSGGVYVAFALP